MKTNNKTMKAMVLSEIQAPLVLKELPIPTLKSGQVLVKIMASGLNPLDLKIQEGLAAHAQVTTPAIIGLDMAGVIADIANDVQRFKVGDEVYGLVGGVGNNQGTLAQYIAVDADHIALKAKNISMKQAAAIPLVLITAWEGLVDRASVSEGKKVLVHGGSGGVGHMAIQIAKAFGAEVYATDSGKGLKYIESLGATAIDYTSMQPEEYVNKYTAGKGFDIVYDVVGGTTLDNSFKSVKKYTGHVLSSLGWGTHSIAPLSFLGATYSGVFTLLPLLSGTDKHLHGQILEKASKLIEQGKIAPLISSKSFNLEQANEAYTALKNRTEIGKVVVELF
ncbi:zinc-dependent alcohol dehydrogenase family protein [Flavobacterium aquiphilum]|uniref:zinc-dependent alcohol dehydrogenase family protein n=1 Tax=Flavobacterium aquiphilum TaxID=3003261 RepID=UPI0024807511|nr:zinc-dependent alcohol dehydrogenase family protein [Flavobacterium aquiphilum]